MGVPSSFAMRLSHGSKRGDVGPSKPGLVSKFAFGANGAAPLRPVGPTPLHTAATVSTVITAYFIAAHCSTVRAMSALRLSRENAAAHAEWVAFAHDAVNEIRQCDRERRFPRGLVTAMAARGMLGLCVPRRLGGLGLDYIALGLAAEALESADASLREVLAVHLGLHALSIYQWGTPEQQARWLPALARGEALGAFALNEKDAGSDVANMACSATRSGDDYVLNGAKTWITLATTADRLLVFARTGAGTGGLSAFVVDRTTAGIIATPREGKLGDWAGDTGDLRFSNVRIPARDRLGVEGEGFKIAMSALDNGRYVVAAGAVGCMKACRDEAVAYAQSRVAFGKLIGEQQLVQQLLANMQQRIDAGELLVRNVGALKNSGVRNTRESSGAKWFCSEAAVQTAKETVQVLGSAGYSDDHNAARHLRNSMAALIYQGTSQIHTLIQADYVLGKRVDKPLRCELPAYTPDA